MLHGDVIGAFEFNPLMVLSLPFLLYALVRYTNAAMRGRPLNDTSLTRNTSGAVCGHLSFWIFRNTRFIRFRSLDF